MSDVVSAEADANKNEQSLAPAPLHLQSLERVMKLPVIEAAYNQGAGVYERVKSNSSQSFLFK